MPSNLKPSKTRRIARRLAPREDLYQTVTDCILAQLEDGAVPWVRLWDPNKATATTMAVDLPRNGATGAAYSGVNILLLWDAAQRHDYPTQRWLTYTQARGLGAQVRRGEASTGIVKAGTFTPAEERQRARDETREPGQIPFLKRHSVFNTAQIDGLPDDDTVAPPPPSLDKVDARVRAILQGLDCRLVHGSPIACYVPKFDVIQLPAPDAFHHAIDWHRTALHEAGHATGAEHRLGRNLTGRRGAASYAREELVAEITAAFVCAAYGIVPTVRHADYIATWAAVLREDKRCIVRAASAASKAAAYLQDIAATSETDGNTPTEGAV